MTASVHLALALLALASGGATLVRALDPANAQNLTLYHEFEPKFEHLGLANQDTGDVRGDAYFVLRSLILPVECASKRGHTYDCHNPEANNTQNVVSRNIVRVDKRFGKYASCNAVESTGTYRCSTPGGGGAAVGRADVKAREVSHGQPKLGAEAWEWWRLNLSVKMGTPQAAYWYSTVEEGSCAANNGAANCTWELLATTRKIVAQCLEARVVAAVRKAAPAACFQDCAQPQNNSSPCVVTCFMGAILGPQGGAHLIGADEGIDPQLIVGAWEAAFDSNDPAKGGCPDAPQRQN